MMNEKPIISTEEITTTEFKKSMYNFTAESKFQTHVGMLEGMRGCFNFNRKGIEELYDTLGNNPNLLFGVAEKPQHFQCSD